MNEMLQLPVDSAAPVARAGSILTCNDHDNSIRWQPGERLQHLFERLVAEYLATGTETPTALEIDGKSISFAALDRRANQMARYLRDQGLGAGDRIGLIVDRSIESYVVLLAVLKLEAAYVPLDVKFPSDRIEFIAKDAGIKAFVVTAIARRLVVGLEVPVFELDALGTAAAEFPDATLEGVGADLPADRLCYIIYTSGSTGRPKGVAVNHSSICNFVQVATEVYGYVPGDRVYQGMTLAFDFSVEELWVPLLSGATLVPSPADRQMVGEELARFLKSKRITAMCCVPTLLATIEDELPDLRLLLVSGEACPQDIVSRWRRPGRRMLNAYGPTEATVTATWTEVLPDKPVTIGVPLPTYTVALLETGRDALVVDGAVGEIAIAGVGLAVGYVNRDDLTAAAFVPDFLHLANNPSRRLYRTGDLGRINGAGEIEYLGRIDTQVKIRGYRIELAEIENVLLEIEGIAQVVVTTFEVEPGLIELAAYYTCFDNGHRPSRDSLLQAMRRQLPGYMVPAYMEELAELPLLASHKADRKALPPPKGLRLVSSSVAFVAPRDETERVIAEVLAQTLKLETVSVEDHFFDDLGAHSLLMSQFLAALNKRLPAAKAAISDVYLAPSVALLGADLKERLALASIVSAPEHETEEPAVVASDFEHLRCGALQVLFYVCQYGLHLGLFAVGVGWISGATEISQLATRAIVFSLAGLVFLMALPIAAKWLLIGRWQAERIPIWSLHYLRFWIVRQLMTLSPWRGLQGTVLFNVFLRLLGAKIGDGALILTEQVPIATDLLRIGVRTVLRKNARLNAYKAEKGAIVLGPIDIGDDVTVGELGLVDVNTSIGDRGQLGHASALLAGQSIPTDRRYHGSPAEETTTEYRHLPHMETSWLRRSAYAAMRLISIALAMAATIIFSVVSMGWPGGSGEGAAVQSALESSQSVTAFGVAEVLGLSLAVLLAGYVLALAAHLVVPRLLRLFLVSGKVYRLYGPHYFFAQMLALAGHAPFFQALFGDSSAIVHYFKSLGMRQPNVKQTGSNFGTLMLYDSPFDIEIGSGSMISDGLSVINYEVGSGSFRVAPAQLGARCFVGNAIVYPSGAQIGDNCLLGTKVMIPADGKVRQNVGLLGSPAFEIPRDVANGTRFNPIPSTTEEHARLAAKNRFNLNSALLYLTSQWMLLFGVMLISYVAAVLYGSIGSAALVGGAILAPLFAIVHNIVADRISVRGIRLKPHNCTIHEPYFWHIERHWKLGQTMLRSAFAGTPLRPIVLRAMGLKVGRKVFDDGASIPEKDLVEIGDNCCLNAASAIQGHSLEDGLFKSDRIVIGNGCTIGTAAFVHYGVRMADGTMLEPDAFLMKGGKTEAGSRWQGNPARVM
jgi:non-ribosomal peptide synthetase-like protein